jgi:hypothetical protein
MQAKEGRAKACMQKSRVICGTAQRTPLLSQQLTGLLLYGQTGRGNGSAHGSAQTAVLQGMPRTYSHMEHASFLLLHQYATGPWSVCGFNNPGIHKSQRLTVSC